MAALLAHSTVVGAFVATLRAAATLTDVPIMRSRVRAISDQVTRAVCVRPTTSDPSGGVILGHPIDWSTAIQVECYARGDASQAADEACGALLLIVADALAVDPSLGGALDDIGDPTLAWALDEADTTLGCLVATYPVTHRTAYRSLAAPT
jgi:hypothetical protein